MKDYVLMIILGFSICCGLVYYVSDDDPDESEEQTEQVSGADEYVEL